MPILAVGHSNYWEAKVSLSGAIVCQCDFGETGIHGNATVTGAAGVNHTLSGNITCVNRFGQQDTASLTVTITLRGSITCNCIVNADNNVNITGQSSCAGLAVLSAVLAVSHPLEAAVPLISSITAKDLHLNIPCQGRIDTVLSCNALNNISLAGTIVCQCDFGETGIHGNCVINGTLTVQPPVLKCNIICVNGITGTLSHTVPLQGTIVCQSFFDQTGVDCEAILLGTLTVTPPATQLQGTIVCQCDFGETGIHGNCVINARLSFLVPLSGKIVCQSFLGPMGINCEAIVRGNLNINHPLSGSISGTSDISGNVFGGGVGGTCAANLVCSGSLNITIPLLGSIISIGTLNGNTNVAITCGGNIIGAEGINNGSSNIQHPLPGICSTSCNITADLTHVVLLQGTVICQSSLDPVGIHGENIIIGNTNVQHNLTGLISTVASGTIGIQTDTTISLTQISTLTGSLTTAIAAQGPINISSNLTEILSAAIPLFSSIAGLNTVSDSELKVNHPLSGAIIDTSSLSGNISLGFTASMDGVLKEVGSLINTISLIGAVTTNTSLTTQTVYLIQPLSSTINNILTITGTSKSNKFLTGMVVNLTTMLGTILAGAPTITALKNILTSERIQYLVTNPRIVSGITKRFWWLIVPKSRR